jgi:uncharacterized protein YrrD
MSAVGMALSAWVANKRSLFQEQASVFISRVTSFFNMRMFFDVTRDGGLIFPNNPSDFFERVLHEQALLDLDSVL